MRVARPCANILLAAIIFVAAGVSSARGETAGYAIGRTAAQKSVAIPASVGHTLLFLFSVTAIDIAYHEILKKGGAPSLLETKEIATMIGIACDSILNDGAIWSGLIAAGSAHAGIEQSLKVLGKILESPEGKSQFRSLLKTSVISTTAFLGWELGSQLWTEATLLVDEPKDLERLSSFRSMAGGAIRGMIYSSRAKDVQDARLMKQMFGNMIKVLADAEKRHHWFDRTWRTRVMTGEFATFLGAMIASGAIGTALFPGAGTFAGLMFGLVGAAVAVVTPQSWKDGMTVGMKTARQAALWNSLEINASELRKRMVAGIGRSLGELIEIRRGLRDSYSTIVFERIHGTLKAARRDGISEAHRNELVAAQAMFRELYAHELKILRHYVDRESLIRVEVTRVGQIDGYLATLPLAELLEAFVKNTTDDAHRALLTEIETAYLQGFSEGRLVPVLFPQRSS